VRGRSAQGLVSYFDLKRARAEVWALAAGSERSLGGHPVGSRVVEETSSLLDDGPEPVRHARRVVVEAVRLAGRAVAAVKIGA
jgi:hypothetical protein